MSPHLEGNIPSRFFCRPSDVEPAFWLVFTGQNRYIETLFVLDNVRSFVSIECSDFVQNLQE
jgi:hypothetical protein